MILRFRPGSARRRNSSGLSLMEIMITVGIGGIILAALAQITVFTARSFVAMGNYADLDRASRTALDTMSRDIRQAKVVHYFSTNSVVFQNLNTNTWFAYSWNQGARTVTKIDGAGAISGANVIRRTPVLSGCDYFCFRVWLRNPTNDFWFPYSATHQPALTKLVDISWRCSRRVLHQFNTESVQTAKIVLRN